MRCHYDCMSQQSEGMMSTTCMKKYSSPLTLVLLLGKLPQQSSGPGPEE